MREILFRGERGNQWVYGSLIKYQDGSTDIATYCGPDVLEKCHVNPKTVSQYIGLHDKNGKKIFEGDIIEGEIKNKEFNCDKFTAMVVFKYEGFMIECLNGLLCGALFPFSGLEPYHKIEEGLEILGNIYDNPEFLEEYKYFLESC